MNLFTHNFTHPTDADSANDASSYPQGQFIDPALLQLNATPSAIPNRERQPVAEMSWNLPGLFETQNTSCPSGLNSFRSHNHHAPGTSTVTPAATSTNCPVAPMATPLPVAAPAHARSESYVPQPFLPLSWCGQNGGMYVASSPAGFPGQLPAHIPHQLPTPAPTPASAQIESNSFIGYYPLLSYYSVHQPQIGFVPLGRGYTSFEASNTAGIFPPLPRGRQSYIPLPPVVTTSRGPGRSHPPTSFPILGPPSEHISTLSTAVPNSSMPSSLGASSYVIVKNIDSSRTSWPQGASARATEQSKPKIRNQKPYTRRMEIVNFEPLVRPSGGPRPPLNLPDPEIGEVEAPPSPKIKVQMVHNQSKRKRRSRAMSQVEGGGESEGARRNPNSDKLWAHIYGGLGPNADTSIQAIEPALDVNETDKSVKPAKPGDRYRCRWDGCRRLVPATRRCVLEHMRAKHRIQPPPSKRGQYSSSDVDPSDETHCTKIACSWCPPLPVRLKLDGGKMSNVYYVTSHAFSYHCGHVIELGSVVNHIGTHLRHEGQPNPMAKVCHCGRAVVTRGSHTCSEKESL